MNYGIGHLHFDLKKLKVSIVLIGRLKKCSTKRRAVEVEFFPDNFFTDTPPQRHRITMNYHHLSSSEINYLPFDLLTEKETSSSIHPST